MAGDGDRISNPRAHSERLHREIPGSELRIVPGVGHMLHQLRPALVMGSVNRLMRGERRAQAPELTLAAPRDEGGQVLP